MSARRTVELHMEISQELLYARISRSNATPPNLVAHFVRAYAIDMHVDISQEQFYARIYRKSAEPQDRDNPAAQTLREPAQSTCTWTAHKATCMREFKGKMLGAKERALIYTLTVRTSVWTRCLGDKMFLQFQQICPCPRIQI